MTRIDHERGPQERHRSERGPLYTTPGGRQRLIARIDAARAAYCRVCDSNEDAAGAGDSSVWHDNFAYEENQRQMHQLARRVRDLELQLATSRVVPLPTEAPETARLGAAVTVEFEDDGSVQRWFLAGFDDGEPAAGRLSYNSPLGRALLGAEVADERLLRLERRVRRFEVVDIEAPTARDDGEVA